MPFLKSMINKKENYQMKCLYQHLPENPMLKILTKLNLRLSLTHLNQMKMLQVLNMKTKKRVKNKSKRFLRRLKIMIWKIINLSWKTKMLWILLGWPISLIRRVQDRLIKRILRILFKRDRIFWEHLGTMGKNKNE